MIDRLTGPRRFLMLARSAAFATWMFTLAIVMGFACLPLLLWPRKRALAPVRLWARWCLTALRLVTGLSVDVRGLENAPTGAALIAAKHQGMLDILVGLTIFPDPCFVLKKELMWIPIFGWFSAKTRMIAIDRSAGPQALRQMILATRDALSEDRQVIVYPEGARRSPNAPPDYKPGIAGLYRELGMACLPMATNSGLFWPAKGLAKHSGTAVFALLEPVSPGLKRRDFMQLLSSRIESASQALTNIRPPGL